MDAQRRQVSDLVEVFRSVVIAREPVASFAVRHQPVAPAVLPARASNLEGAARFCLAYRGACELGWLVYPPFDAEVTWRGGRNFDVVTDPDAALEENLWKATMKARTGWASSWYCSKITGVLQIDPGLTFVTPRGVKLLLTETMNRPRGGGAMIQSGVLDSDWFWVPTTINLQFTNEGDAIRLSRAEPLAQLVPLTTISKGEMKNMETIDGEQFPDVEFLTAAYQDHKYGPAESWGEELPNILPGTYAKLRAAMDGDLPLRIAAGNGEI